MFHSLDDIKGDEALSQYRLSFHAIKGMCAFHLDPLKLNLKDVSHVVVVLGNNDISRHPTKSRKIYEPDVTAQYLINFARDVEDAHNIRVLVVGLLPRGDVCRSLVQKCNSLLCDVLETNYVSPRGIHPKHFGPLEPHHRRPDKAHFNSYGVQAFMALILRIVEKRLY